MAKSRFVYNPKGRSVEETVRRSKQSSGLYDSYINSEFSKLKVKEGENQLRILPPSWLKYDKAGELIEDELSKRWGVNWDIQVYVHYNIGPDGGSFLCLDKMGGEPCPVCEARRNAADDDEADKLKPSWRALCWAIDRNNEKAGPQIWDMPATLFRDINARSVDKKSGSVIQIDNHEEGFDLSFTREGSDLRTKYVGVEVERDATPLHDDEKQQDRWLDYIMDHPLPDVLLFQDAEYIEKVMSGRVARASRDETEETETSRGESRRVARRPSPEPEVEEEEVQPRNARAARRAEPEPEEEEIVPPRGGHSRVRPAAEPEPEEEEPAPRQGRRRAAEVEEEVPFEEDEPTPPRSGRRRPAAEPEEEEEVPAPSRSARRGLEKLRTSR